MLTRYWFRVSEVLGYGVTAASRKEAEGLLHSFGYPRAGERVVEIVENIDFQLLDQNHVLPNAGPSVIRGVWFPRHNL